MSMENQRLRILCLHGRGQNVDVFRQKTGQFRKRLKKYADFEYINAPHKIIINTIQTENIPSNEMTDQRTWWYKSKDKEFNSKEATNVSDDVEESLSHLENVFNQKGPFDGILGFSEGALLLALACAMQKSFLNKIKFVILVAGCLSPCVVHRDLYVPNKVKIPSLHVIGETDGIIVPNRSKELVKLFEDAEVFFHTGGHFIPASRDSQETYAKFLDKFVQK